MDFGQIADRAKFWWQAKDGAVHDSVRATVSAINAQQRATREDTAFYMDLVSNANVAGNGQYGYLRAGNGASALWPSKMRVNLCCAAVDTAASLIAQNRTAPIYTTTAGNFALSRKAEQRSRVIQSQFYDLGVYEVGADVFRDGASTGTGFLFGYVDDVACKPRVERVLPNEVFIDDADGQYRCPRSIYRVKFVARDALKALYPKKSHELTTSGGPEANDYSDFFQRADSMTDRVRVYEAWHVGSKLDRSDGRHVICTDNCTLRDEPWTKKRFPFSVYRYANRLVGFFGQGLCERVAPAQIRMNELMQVKKDCQDLTSNAIIACEENSEVEWEQLSNLPGTVLYYRGTAPQLLVWSGTPPDIAAECELIKQEVWDNEGFSQAMASGEAPKGAESARAVRAKDDVSSRRQIQPTRQFEQFYLDVCELIGDLNDECAAINPDYSVTGRSRIGRQTFLKSSKWTDLALPEGDCRVTLFPMNALPTTPQGKFSALQEYIDGGYMSKPWALDLMEFPDVEAWQQLENAEIDLVQWQIERILDGHHEIPTEYQDLRLVVPIMNQALLVAYRMEAPAEIQLAFTSFLKHARELLPTPLPQQAIGPAALNPNAAAAAQVALASGGAAGMAA